MMKRRECFVVMELMSKDLSSYIRKVCCSRRRIPFPLLVTVDVMLQIARGMEYLHSKTICHGDLNPSNILVKVRDSSPDCHLQVKDANFGQSRDKTSLGGQAVAGAANPCIWYAPEILSEQEKPGGNSSNRCKYTEKADVHSFAMICFELLTGKVPFVESHLQGDEHKGGRKAIVPFPFTQVYLSSLTKRCWQADPLQRPSFSSISRMLHLVMNLDLGQAELPNPPVDYFGIEMNLSKRLMSWGRRKGVKVSEIPFQMYAYRVIKKERTNSNFVKEKGLDSGSEEASVCGDENGSHGGNVSSEKSLQNNMSSVNSLSINGSEGSKKISLATKIDGKPQKQTGKKLQYFSDLSFSLNAQISVMIEDHSFCI